MSNLSIVVDATNLSHVEFHANPHGAAERLAAKVRALKAAFSPRFVVACWDSGTPWRKAIFDGYKAGRGTKPHELLRTLEECREALSQIDEVDHVSLDTWEADDLAATVMDRCVKAGYRVAVVSRDKDVRQLAVEGKVTIAKEVRMDRGAVEVEWLPASKINPRPEQYADFLALAGDAGDGIPGCEGIGKVTAAKLLAERGSLCEIVRDPWSCDVSPKQRSRLLAFRSQMDLMFRLTVLRRDAPIEWEPVT